MEFAETTWRDALGGLVIRAKLGAAVGRSHFERGLFPGVEVGLVGWERSHSQGSGTGHESPLGIVYAPAEVNRVYQNAKIERFLRELVEMRARAVDLWLTTVTHTHSGTRRLKSIEYRVDAVGPGRPGRTLFEACIHVDDRKHNPRVYVTATSRSDPSDWAVYFRPR